MRALRDALGQTADRVGDRIVIADERERLAATVHCMRVIDRLCVWARNVQQTGPATTPAERTDTILRRWADPPEPDDG